MSWLYFSLWFVGLCIFVILVFNKSEEEDELENCVLAGAFYLVISYSLTILIIYLFFRESTDWPPFMEGWRIYLSPVPMIIGVGWLTVRVLLRKNKIDTKDRPPIP